MMVLHLFLESHDHQTSEADAEDNSASAGRAGVDCPEVGDQGALGLLRPVYARGRFTLVRDLDPGPGLPRRLNLSLPQKDISE